MASQEEIKEVEKACTIPEEEDEDEDEEDENEDEDEDEDDNKDGEEDEDEDEDEENAVAREKGRAMPSENMAKQPPSASTSTAPNPKDDLEEFRKSLERTGTNLSLLEQRHNVDDQQVLEAELKKVTSIPSPTATEHYNVPPSQPEKAAKKERGDAPMSPVEELRQTLSRTGTNLDAIEKKHGYDADQVLEAELEHEHSIIEEGGGGRVLSGPSASKGEEGNEGEKRPMSPIEELVQSLSRTGTSLDNLKQEHGVDDDELLEQQLEKETSIGT